MNLFNNLNIIEIENFTYIKNYKANSILFNEGNLCDKIGMIIQGEVKIVTFTHNEKEETITILNKDDYFGDILIFSEDSNYLGIGICTKDTTIRYINKDNLLYLLESNSNFLKDFLTLISSKALSLKQELKLFKHKNIRDRIIYYLTDYQKDKDNSKIYISNISNLASILSIPRPSVSREISSMIKDGIIIKNKDCYGTYIIVKK